MPEVQPSKRAGGLAPQAVPLNPHIRGSQKVSLFTFIQLEMFFCFFASGDKRTCKWHLTLIPYVWMDVWQRGFVLAAVSKATGRGLSFQLLGDLMEESGCWS